MSRRTVNVRPALRRILVAQAQASKPRECCGLLVGAGTTIQFAVPTPNRARSTTRYVVDPGVHLELQRLLRRFVPALEVVGAYHSHPRGRAEPSSRDIAEASDPAWVHLIVGLVGKRPQIGAFRVAGEKVEPLRLRWR